MNMVLLEELPRNVDSIILKLEIFDMGSGYFGMYGDTMGSRGRSALLLEPPCWLPLAGGGGDMVNKQIW